MRRMEKSTIMLVGYLEVPRAPVSWPLKPRGLRQYSEWVASIHQFPQEVFAEKLASPYQQQDASTQSVRRNVPDFKLLEATLDAIVVGRPSPTDEAPQHLCLDIGYDNEPRRDVLLERGNIAHINSIGEEKDEAGQRCYQARRWVMERTLGWLSKCRAIFVRYEKNAVIASSIGLTSKALPILCSACPVLATWGIGPWDSRCLTLVGHTIAPGKEDLATHYPRCLHGI
jgi:transposase